MFCYCINAAAYHLGRYKPSSPPAKELNALTDGIKYFEAVQVVTLFRIQKMFLGYALPYLTAYSKSTFVTF